MMKRKILGILIVGIIIGIALLSGYVQQEKGYSFPESREEFEIQGLTWRTISYYYHPGIYGDIQSGEQS